MEDIMDEIYEGNQHNIDQIIKIVYDQPYNYLFINTDTQRMFKNFDEFIFSDNIQMDVYINDLLKEIEQLKKQEDNKPKYNTIEKPHKKT